MLEQRPEHGALRGSCHSELGGHPQPDRPTRPLRVMLSFAKLLFLHVESFKGSFSSALCPAGLSAVFRWEFTSMLVRKAIDRKCYRCVCDRPAILSPQWQGSLLKAYSEKSRGLRTEPWGAPATPNCLGSVGQETQRPSVVHLSRCRLSVYRRRHQTVRAHKQWRQTEIRFWYVTKIKNRKKTKSK